MLSEDIYRENIMDHFKHPHNKGIIQGPTVHHKEYNPSCGDLIEIYLVIEDDKIKEIKFSGHGCAISQASVSMLTDKVMGMPIKDIVRLSKEKILDMLKIPISATRIKCALLGLRTIEKALIGYQAGEDV